MSANVRQLAAMLVLGIAAPCLAQSSGLQWERNLDDAKRVAAASNRLILVHFTASWCQPCQRLEKQVFNQPGFGQALSARYVAVKLDYDENQAMATRWGVQAIPTDVILSPQGQPLQKVQSPPTAEAYVATMQRVADYAIAAVAAAAPPPANDPTTSAAARVASTAPPLGDRYASYAPPQAQPSAQQVTAPTVPANTVANPPTQEPSWRASPADIAAQNSAPSTPVAQQVAATSVSSSEPKVNPSPAAASQLPPDCPRLGLDGFCPVTLLEKRAWAHGDARWGAIHRGRTYLFVSDADQKKFLANPDHYSPVMSGDDAVVATEEGRSVAGDRRYGVFYENRVFLFHDEQSLKAFAAHPNRYAAEISQVMRP